MLRTALFSLAAALVLPACATSDAVSGPTTIATEPMLQLRGGAFCDLPMHVSGTARDDRDGTIDVTATLRCGENHVGVAGAVLAAQIPDRDDTIERDFPSTNARGTAQLALDISDVDVLPSRVRVAVYDVDGEEVDAFDLPVR